MVNWKHISWMVGSLILAALLALAYSYKGSSPQPMTAPKLPPLVTIPRKEFSPKEFTAIQETFWTKIQGKDRSCAEAFVHKHMDALRERCEIEGGAEHISGGCAHMTNPMNYPEVLEAGLTRCGIKL